ncbi:DUF167 domain-containing protein [Desulfobacca acetoxidans]|uniref:DUF167 domain-containing protein n=1 Tax=Desulfobacca acetoxidans TaxID=60893 RepID=UPI0009FDE200|nr:DUF167 domain-containing protein [Desulfobacca acetoxidans]
MVNQPEQPAEPCSQPGKAILEWLLPTRTGYFLRIHVVPGAASNQIMGPHGDRLKIRIAAAPEKGAANKELLNYLAKCLGLPKNRLHLKSGAQDRVKVVEVVGLAPEVQERLQALWPSVSS